jgi:hypothetical protein
VRTDRLPTVCPNCGKVLDAVTGVDHENAPVAGSVTICINCSGLSVFQDDLTLREPTPEEMADLMAQPEVQRVLMALGKYRARLSG